MKRKVQTSANDREFERKFRAMPLAKAIDRSRRTEGATIGERPELALRDQGARIDASAEDDRA